MAKKGDKGRGTSEPCLDVNLRDHLIDECKAMAKHALSNGLAVPPRIVGILRQYETTPVPAGEIPEPPGKPGKSSESEAAAPTGERGKAAAPPVADHYNSLDRLALLHPEWCNFLFPLSAINRMSRWIDTRAKSGPAAGIARNGK